MPIFYKNDSRVLFMHVPKTAGVAVYTWFVENGWLLSNLKLHQGGAGDVFWERFKISQLQAEYLWPAGVNPQHATAEDVKLWGDFDSVFCLVRDPMARYLSELNYRLPGLLKKNGVTKVDDQKISRYVDSFTLEFLGKKFYEDSSILDNHLRPQVDFVRKDAEMFFYENDWASEIGKRYHLRGKPDKLNERDRLIDHEKHVSEQVRNVVYEFYKVDYERFGY